MTAKTLTIEAIESISELELKNINAEITYSTNLGLVIVVFSEYDLDNLSFYVYLDTDDIEADKEKINKLIETIKLDNYKEIMKLHMNIYTKIIHPDDSFWGL